MNPILSIIIVNWNTQELLQNCLYSIYNTDIKTSFEIIVVDNASSDGSVVMLKEKFPFLQIVTNKENVGFARANNQAIKMVKGKYILLLNPDTIILKGSLDKMCKFMKQHSDVGVVGCKVLGGNGLAQRSWCGFPTAFKEFLHAIMLGKALDSLKIKKFGKILYKISKSNFARYMDTAAPTEVDIILGACLMVRKETIDEIGLLDENFFMFIEEGEWCYRIKQHGWKIYFFPGATIIHLGGESTKQNIGSMILSRYKSLFHFFKKHHGSFYYYIVKGMIIIGVTIRMIVFFLGNTSRIKQQTLKKVTIQPINFHGFMESKKLWKIYKEVINIAMHYSE